MALSGSILPIHPNPHAGESLSSWLTRLAIFHRVIPSIFFRNVIRSQAEIYKQDIDVRCPLSTLQEISILTGTRLDVVERTTFKPFLNNLYLHSETSTALPRWIGPNYIRRNTSHHYGLKVCPKCMEESPYIQLFWRCVFFVVCPKHKVRMSGKCERCGSPKSSRKIFPKLYDDYPDDALCFCHNCGWDYREGSCLAATDADLAHVVTLLNVFEQGFYRSNTLQIGYSHLFFEGIRLLMNGLFRLDQVSNVQAEKNSELEFKSIDTVISLMGKTFFFLQNWPVDFVHFCIKESIGQSHWVHPRALAPYWLLSVLRWHLNFARHSTSLEEIRCAATWLQQTGKVSSRKNIVSLLGVNARPRSLSILAKNTFPLRLRLRQELSFSQLCSRCLSGSHLKFVRLRTLLYSIIFLYTDLAHSEISALEFNSEIIHRDKFQRWLVNLGSTFIEERYIEDAWEFYKKYVEERKKWASHIHHGELLFFSTTGNPLTISLAVKSMNHLILKKDLNQN